MNLQQFVQYAQENGGGSLHLPSGNINPTRGYMVSLKGAESKMSLSLDNARFFCTKHIERLFLSDNKDTYFGMWLKNGTWYYDVSINMEDEDSAIAFGKANEQIAIWDCAKGDEIVLDYIKPIMVQHGDTMYEFVPTSPECKEECGSFEYEYSESEGMVKVWDISHPVSKECVYRMQVAPRFAKPDESEQKYEVTFHRLYITTIDVTASSESEAQILAHKRLYEQELEQMNVDLQDVYVKKV